MAAQQEPGDSRAQSDLQPGDLVRIREGYYSGTLGEVVARVEMAGKFMVQFTHAGERVSFLFSPAELEAAREDEGAGSS